MGKNFPRILKDKAQKHNGVWSVAVVAHTGLLRDNLKHQVKGKSYAPRNVEVMVAEYTINGESMALTKVEPLIEIGGDEDPFVKSPKILCREFVERCTMDVANNFQELPEVWLRRNRDKCSQLRLRSMLGDSMLE